MSSQYGKGETYWDKNWQNSNIESAIKFCEISPIKAILDTYFPKKGKILDGGCGLGQIVIYYKNRGYDIEGVDFAPRVIERILAYDKTIKVQEGDILKLPYQDNSFSAYYSGGVVEHFEEGPKLALREARRVLKKGAVLIITVPYFNPSRRIRSFLSLGFKNQKSSTVKLDFNGMKSMFLLTNVHRRTLSPFPGFSFHQYEYTKKEFSQILNNCGFNIIFSRGISIIWGLMDNDFFRKVVHKMLTNRENNRSLKDSEDREMDQSKTSNLSKKIKSYLKKMLISEDTHRIGFGRFILKVLQYTSGNLILFVCKAR